jgi:hypothetical protein
VKDLVCPTLGVVRSCLVCGGLMVLLENHQPKAWCDEDGIRVCQEASKRGTRGVIEELASEVSKPRWMCVRLMSLFMY